MIETKFTGETRTIGTFELELTNEPFVSETNQSIKIGLGATLSLSDYEGINITNRRSGATYSFKPKDTSIISNDMVATKHGTTTVEIEETYLNKATKPCVMTAPEPSSGTACARPSAMIAATAPSILYS